MQLNHTTTYFNSIINKLFDTNISAVVTIYRSLKLSFALALINLNKLQFFASIIDMLLFQRAVWKTVAW